MKFTAERIEDGITLLIRLSLIVAIIGEIINHRWTVLFVTVATLILTFIPSIIERNYKIDLPAEFEILIVLFIYMTLFLGEVHDYYTRYWWWDLVLHTSSAVAFALIGFMIIFLLYERNKIKARPIIIAIFTFCFALAIGALWEIFEFGMDSLFGLNMQKSGLVDTMWDLIVDSAGALIVAIAGYFYVRKGKTYLFARLVKKFLKENPKLS
jgi:hypothetical protein